MRRGERKFDLWRVQVRAHVHQGLFEESAICAQATGVPLRGTSYYRVLPFIPVPFFPFFFLSRLPASTKWIIRDIRLIFIRGGGLG